MISTSNTCWNIGLSSSLYYRKVAPKNFVVSTLGELRGQGIPQVISVSTSVNSWALLICMLKNEPGWFWLLMYYIKIEVIRKVFVMGVLMTWLCLSQTPSVYLRRVPWALCKMGIMIHYKIVWHIMTFIIDETQCWQRLFVHCADSLISAESTKLRTSLKN